MILNVLAVMFLKIIFIIILGNQNQSEYKVWSYTFATNFSKDKDIILKCQHFQKQLKLFQHPNDLNVYIFQNNNCLFYLKNKSSLNKHDTKLYKEHLKKIKHHYIYHKFNIDTPELSKDYKEFIQSPIDLSKAYSPQYIIVLCLSYRQIASILNDVHEIKISYKIVKNYCSSYS